MSQITGRDIYSINEWQTILLAANYVKENRVVIEITDAIIKYHQLEKKKQTTSLPEKKRYLT